MIHTKTALSRTLSVMYIIALGIFCFADFRETVSLEDTVLWFRMDKVAHFIMFLPFPILAFLSFEHRKKTKIESVKFTAATLFVGIMVAASTEVIQGRLPYRTLEMADFYADCLAIFLCSIYVLTTDIMRHRKKSGKSR